MGGESEAGVVSYEMQLLVDDEWKGIRATRKEKPYRYPDRASAEYMLRICYPDQHRDQRLGGDRVVRVVEVNEEANMDKYP